MMTTSSTRAEPNAEKTASPEFPVNLLNGLPMTYRSKNNIGESSLYRMQKSDCLISYEGQQYLGIQLWGPMMPDPVLEWLVASPTDSMKPEPWLLVGSDGHIIHECQPEAKSPDNYPRIMERYPKTKGIACYQTSGGMIKQGKHFYLLQRMTGNPQDEFAIAITSPTGQGYENFGQLAPNAQQTFGRATSDAVIETMKEIRRNQNIGAATEYLGRELEIRMDDFEANPSRRDHEVFRKAWLGFHSIYSLAYLEAQQGGGRLSNEWASSICDTIFQTCHRREYYHHMMEIAVMLTNHLNSAGRYGRLTEVFTTWSQGMKLGGYQMDPRTYPDNGQAFDFLPKVHHRKIPALVPCSQLKVADNSRLRLPATFNYIHNAAIQKYADQLWRNGQWQESLEWLLWCQQWAQESLKKGRDEELSAAWHHSVGTLASRIESLGFTDESLAIIDSGLNADHNGYYFGRSITEYKLNKIRIHMELEHPAPPDLTWQIEQLIEEIRANIHMGVDSVKYARTILAQALIYTGKAAEGEALFNELADQGYWYAKSERLAYWCRTGRVDGVENEFIALLNDSRKAGNKLNEVWLYSRYADFLEKQGCLQESLRVRRETIRLRKTFDLYTRIPLELAKLAALLEKVGSRKESQTAEAEALELLKSNTIPGQLAEETRSTLGKINRSAAALAASKSDIPKVDFQPQQVVVIPTKGSPWSTFLTLTNPSDKIEKGILSGVGMPMNLKLLDGQLNVRAAIGTTQEKAELPLEIPPGSYSLIEVTPADGKEPEGKLTFTWNASTKNQTSQSTVEIEAPASGGSSSVIQAGVIQLNPYYGVPIYHQYLGPKQNPQSKPLRFIASQPARVEIYLMDGTPAGIDAQGNGSLQDIGDELFIESDGLGHLQLPLKEGNAVFMIVVYPIGAIPEKGLMLNIEAFAGGKWEDHSQDLILPPSNASYASK